MKKKYYCQAEIEGRKKCSEECQHCNEYFSHMKTPIHEGDIVTDLIHNIDGVVVEVFENWDDLKSKSDFLTLDPYGKAKNSDIMDLLINGDPRDQWLNMQNIKITADQLLEPWYSIRHPNGGASWLCHSRIKLSPKSN